MKCEKCGKEIPVGIVVCEYCGVDVKTEGKHGISLKKPRNTIQEQPPIIGDDGEIYPSRTTTAVVQEADIMPASNTAAPLVPTDNSEKKRIPYKLIAIAAGCVVVLSIGIGILSNYNSPKEQMYRSIENGDYEKAYDLYAENFSDKKIPDKLLDVFWDRLDAAKQQFISKEKNYSETKLEIERVGSMGIEALDEKVQLTMDYVNALNDSRTAYSLGIEYMGSGDYPKAMEQFKKVIEDDHDYSSAQDNYNRSVDFYRSEQLDKAAYSVESGNIDAAIIVVSNALNILNNDSELTKQLDIYNSIKSAGEISNILLEIDTKVESGDYVAALGLLKTALNTYPDNADVKTKYSDVEGKYISSVIDEADSLMQMGDYDSALQRLDNAKNVLPDNKTLSDKYTTVSNNKPVQLKDIKMQNAINFALESGACEDIIGNVYSGNNVFVTGKSYGSSTGNCEFYLGGKYSSITGIAAPKNSFKQNRAINFEIYADGVLKFSNKITQKTLAFTFEADVSGAEWIMIKASSISGFSNYDADIIIHNPVLFKSQ